MRVVRYVYWKTGDVANIVIKDEGVAPPEDADRYNWHRSLACYYTTSGQLWQVLWDRWLLDGEGRVNVHQKLAAREFRYDSPRARYMSRAVDPETWQPFEPADPNAAISHGEWTDYLGDQPWGDFAVSTPRVAGEPQPPVTGAVRRYLPGFGVQAVETIAASGPNRVTYFHGDLIRSNWATSETGEVAETTTAYTAFGENLAGTPGGPGGLDPETRYAFAGGWGYESGLLTLDGAPGTAPITLQHLGARWYQPEIGRFVQRDPIGLGGGLAVYAYSEFDPVALVDPLGLAPRHPPLDRKTKEIIRALRGTDKMIEEARRSGALAQLRGLLAQRARLLRAARLVPVVAFCVWAYPYLEQAVTWNPTLPDTGFPLAGKWRRELQWPP